jgi:hypothetical protein
VTPDDRDKLDCIRGMFCPECKSEYRPGFTRCSDCGVPLVEQPPAEHSPELVRLRSYSTDGEAFLARSVLESAGIDAIVSPPKQPIGPLGRSFGIGLPATDLYVRSEDFVIANEVLLRATTNT